MLVEERFAGEPSKIWKNCKLQDSSFLEKRPIPIWSRLFSIFLPIGFPATVKPDYLSYQFFDSLQALFSTLTGILATKELLKGLGVGSEDASASQATLTFLLKDGVSMMTRIWFAHQFAPRFMCNIKSWRFMADVFNDLGYFFEFFAATVSKDYFIWFATLSGMLRCCVGVCGGASRMSLTMHFALNHNESDLDAKDGSQETLVNLCGMLFGWLMMKSLEKVVDERLNALFVWTLFLVFTFFHLIFNYLAVSAVELDCLNEQRCKILLKSYVMENQILSPKVVAKKENILWPIFTKKLIQLGCPLTMEVIECLKDDEIHIRIGDCLPIQIFLHQNADDESILLAYMASMYSVYSGKTVQECQEILEAEDFISGLKVQGWQLHLDALGVNPYRFNTKLD